MDKNVTAQQERERDTKRYTYSLDRVCVCGHRLGEHTAARLKGSQPCLVEDCEGCECFKPARASK